jgi:hypothetical protein
MVWAYAIQHKGRGMVGKLLMGVVGGLVALAAAGSIWSGTLQFRPVALPVGVPVTIVVPTEVKLPAWLPLGQKASAPVQKAAQVQSQTQTPAYELFSCSEGH